LLKFAQISKVYTLQGTKVVPSAAVEISCTSVRAYAWRAAIFRPGYKHFLTSNFASKLYEEQDPLEAKPPTPQQP